MAILKILAVWDSALQAYARPIFVPQVGVAVRSFADEVNRAAPDNQVHNHPDDFELHSLGLWNEETGVFSGEDKRNCVARAKDLKQTSNV